MEPEQQSQNLPQEPRRYDAQVFVHRSDKKRSVLVLLVVLFVVAIGGLLWWQSGKNSVKAPALDQKSDTSEDTITKEAPKLATAVVIDGRSHVWDIQFLPDKTMLFTERGGTISAFKGGTVQAISRISDVKAQGEGGLMGLAIDPMFTKNRYVYTCYNTVSDIRVVRWRLTEDLSGLTDRFDMVTGIPSNPSGRHSGCRVAFGLDGYVWIGTGDTAQDKTPQTPQDPKSLAGKILRVDREGKGAPGNVSGNFDARIYSYGHRNTQGIAFFERSINGVPGVSAEHGSSVDDEVNPLKSGNFGWAPPDGPYDESVPMTDKDRFPDAVEAVWSSGDPTQAPSGAAVLKGAQWQAWDGAVVLAMLKTQHLKVLELDDRLNLSKETRHFENEFGRLRSVTLAPDGSLYLSTDNGTNDKIIRVAPR